MLTFGMAGGMMKRMTEKWQLKGVDWGRLMIDEHGLPEVAYAPAPRSRVLPCSHLLANESLKIVAHGNGGLFPFIFPGPVVNLCGKEVTGPGAPALLVREGGRLNKVVGLDDPKADHSDVITSQVLLSPFAASLQFKLSDVQVTRRVALPVSGLPAVMTIQRVTNHGKGVRWISLLEVWSLAPYIVDSGGGDSGFFSRHLSAVLGRASEGNGYFKETSVGSPVRVETTFGVQPDVAAKFRPELGDWKMPQLQFVALTRNVKMHVGKLPVAITTAVDPTGDSKSHTVLRRVVAESRFEVPAGKSLYGALLTWFGDWDEAKDGLRRLLPVPHFEQNEAVLWRKRVWPGLVARSSKEPEKEAFEGLWFGGCTLGALQRVGDTGVFCPPLGFDTFVRGVGHSCGEFATTLEALSWLDPRRVLLSLEEAVPRLTRGLRGEVSEDRRVVEGGLWLLVSLAYYHGLHGAHLSDDLRNSLPEALELLDDLLQREDLYGSAELLTTRSCDPDADRAHALPQVPSRAEGVLESVQATAILVRGCEMFVHCFENVLPEACASLALIAARHRDALEALIVERDVEPWVLRGLFVPDPEASLDHLVALLWMGLPDELADALWVQVEEGLKQERKASLQWAPRLFCEAVRRDETLPARYLAERRLIARGRWPCADWHSLMDPVSRESHLSSARGTFVWPKRDYATSSILHHLAFFGIEVSARGLVCRSPESLEVARLQLPVLELRAGARTYVGEWRGRGESVKLMVEFRKRERTAELEMKKGESWSIEKVLA